MNGPGRFGWVTRAIHWAMAAGIFAMLALGTYVARMEVSLGNLWLYALHKSVGLTLLALVLVRVAWHRVSPPPGPIGGVRPWQMQLARGAHGGLYALMFLVPLSGWLASAATGLDVIWWGWTLPRIAPVSEAWSTGLFAAHVVLTKVLMALVVLHVAGAMWRTLAHRDGTLARMVRGTPGVVE
jgi:cytochrome b561